MEGGENKRPMGRKKDENKGESWLAIDISCSVMTRPKFHLSLILISFPKVRCSLGPIDEYYLR